MEARGPIRIAAAGDVHIREQNRDEVAAAFAGLEGSCDAILVAGDLTTHGEPDQARMFAEAVQPLHVPTVVVLGNHYLHVDRGDEFRAALEESGITVLERETAVIEIAGMEVGIVGLKGFVGGFASSNLRFASGSTATSQHRGSGSRTSTCPTRPAATMSRSRGIWRTAI